jgi:hypothetical protein
MSAPDVADVLDYHLPRVVHWIWNQSVAWRYSRRVRLRLERMTDWRERIDDLSLAQKLELLNFRR